MPPSGERDPGPTERRQSSSGVAVGGSNRNKSGKCPSDPHLVPPLLYSVLHLCTQLNRTPPLLPAALLEPPCVYFHDLLLTTPPASIRTDTALLSAAMPSSARRMKACHCHLCNGTPQPHLTWRRHNEAPAAGKSSESINNLADDVFKLTLQGETFLPKRKHRETILSENSTSHSPPDYVPRLPCQSTLASASLPKISLTNPPSNRASLSSETFDALTDLDNQIHARILRLNGLRSLFQGDTNIPEAKRPLDSVMMEEVSWFREAKDKVQMARAYGDLTTERLRASVQARIQEALDEIEVLRQYSLESTPDRQPVPQQEILFDTGENQ
jgi:hypothetical protein